MCVALGVMCDAVNYLGLVCVCSIKHRDRSGYSGRSFSLTHTHTPLNVRLEVGGSCEHEYCLTHTHLLQSFRVLHDICAVHYFEQ